MDNEITLSEDDKPLILVADDDHSTQALLDRLLTKSQFRVYAAMNGPTAIELAQSLRPLSLIHI